MEMTGQPITRRNHAVEAICMHCPAGSATPTRTETVKIRPRDGITVECHRGLILDLDLVTGDSAFHLGRIVCNDDLALAVDKRVHFCLGFDVDIPTDKENQIFRVAPEIGLCAVYDQLTRDVYTHRA